MALAPGRLDAATTGTGTAPGPAPDPYLRTATTDAAILARVRDTVRRWEPGREALMRTAWRNILFYRGHQWIVFDRALGRWRPSELRGHKPRPVTNRYASTMDAWISVTARVEPTLTFRPATDEAEDRATADVADRVVELVEDEVQIRAVRQELATWAGFTPGVWLETGLDPSPIHGTRLLQDQACADPACGAVSPPTETGTCGACGGPTTPAVDATGAPQGRRVPIGKFYVDICTCFEMYFDPAITPWTRQTKYERRKALAVEDAQARWPDLAITADSGTNQAELYQAQLPTLAGALPDRGGTGWDALGTGAAQRPASRVLEKWYYEGPTAAYPEGLLVIRVGEQLATWGPLPYQEPGPDGTPRPLLNHVHFPTKPVPGSAWSKTVADDLAVKQAQRNRVEALIELLLMRTANPVWLVPEGANVTHFTGEPGQVIRYNAYGMNPRPPERVAGQGIPNGLITWLQLIDEDFEELAATFELIKGTRPAGVSAGIALQILEERSKSRFAPLFIEWEAAWARWARQALAIFRQFATEPRLLKIQGKDGGWQVQQFLGADLAGRVDVVAEAGSSLPRSTLVQRATAEQVLAQGMLDRTDPEVQEQFLALFGMSHFLPGMKLDAQNAAQQNQAFGRLAETPAAVAIVAELLAAVAANEQQFQVPVPYATIVELAAQRSLLLPRVRPTVDNHQIFAREHAQCLKGWDAQQWPRPAQDLLERKQAEHVRLAQQQMLLAAQAQAGTFPTAGYLSNPGGQQGPSPGTSGSSPQRMEGEAREMQQAAT